MMNERISLLSIKQRCVALTSMYASNLASTLPILNYAMRTQNEAVRNIVIYKHKDEGDTRQLPPKVNSYYSKPSYK